MKLLLQEGGAFFETQCS